MSELYTTKMSGSGKIIEKRFRSITGNPTGFHKLLITAITLLLILLAVFVSMAASGAISENEKYKIEITVNGKKAGFVNKPFFDGETLYLPLYELAELFEEGSVTEENGAFIFRFAEYPTDSMGIGIKKLNYTFKFEPGMNAMIVNPEGIKHKSVSVISDHPPVIKGTIYVPYKHIEYAINKATQNYYLGYEIWDMEKNPDTKREPDFITPEIHMDFGDNPKNEYIKSLKAAILRFSGFFELIL